MSVTLCVNGPRVARDGPSLRQCRTLNEAMSRLGRIMRRLKPGEEVQFEIRGHFQVQRNCFECAARLRPSI